MYNTLLLTSEVQISDFRANDQFVMHNLRISLQMSLKSTQCNSQTLECHKHKANLLVLPYPGLCPSATALGRCLQSRFVAHRRRLTFARVVRRRVVEMADGSMGLNCGWVTLRTGPAAQHTMDSSWGCEWAGSGRPFDPF